MRRLSTEPSFLSFEEEDEDFEAYLPDDVRERLLQEARPNIKDSEMNMRHTDPEKWLRMVRKPTPRKPPKAEVPKTVYDRRRAKKEAREETETDKGWEGIWK